MARILVSGLINIETTLAVDGFPIEYCPVRYPFFGVRSTVSGVGYNISKALTVLGDSVDFLSIIGNDSSSVQIYQALQTDNIPAGNVLQLLEETPQSVILYDPDGQRQINVDLKDIQETSFPKEKFEQVLERCELAVLCNINFSRDMLRRAKQVGVLIATDVHSVASLDAEYDADFMRYADILFLSHESLPTTPEDFALQLQARWGVKIIVIGLGEEGALLAVKSDNYCERISAIQTRPIVNTIGAGDALFSAFIHYYMKSKNSYEAIKWAILFASYKIGERGAADGFLDEQSLAELYKGYVT